tara:strand:+ start:494 stop:757 length:264 start_codon:yes stop_codon:yes gene_type:complete
MEFIVGTVTGYLFGCFIGGDTEGVHGRIHFEWFIRATGLHLHHWLIFLLILIVHMLVYDEWNPYVDGFLTGGIIHGLTYRDWYRVIV